MEGAVHRFDCETKLGWDSISSAQVFDSSSMRGQFDLAKKEKEKKKERKASLITVTLLVKEKERSYYLQ